jgi:hypothetical protein
MALLSQMFREVAITGSTERLNAWWADRQGGRWAEQTVRNAFPTASHPPAPPADPSETLRRLTELRDGGVISDAEFGLLRTRLRV